MRALHEAGSPLLGSADRGQSWTTCKSGRGPSPGLSTPFRRSDSGNAMSLPEAFRGQSCVWTSGPPLTT
eukprot:15192585-Alexandrium_andersonii.AAC.1